MHHLLAWRVSAADATATDITPVPDPLMAVNNGHFVPQQNLSLLFAYLGAASINRGRFITPTFRQITTPWIRPINPAIVPVDEPNVCDYRSNPLVFKALEEIQLEATQTSGGAAVIVCVAGVAPVPPQSMPSGDIYTMRGTGTTTCVAGAWTLCTITWQDSLPAGKYACVGLDSIGTTNLAARLVFEDQFWRPGSIGQSLATGSGSNITRKGGLGVWGRFDANRMPSVEFLCNAADTAQEVYMDFIRIG